MKAEPGHIQFGNQIGFGDLIKDKEATKVEFRIISCKDIDNLVLSYKQVVVILEALHNFKEDIKKIDCENVGDTKSRYAFKINEINELFNYLQEGIKYDFQGQLNKCKNKWLKQLKRNKNDDTGTETFSWLKE